MLVEQFRDESREWNGPSPGVGFGLGPIPADLEGGLEHP